MNTISFILIKNIHAHFFYFSTFQESVLSHLKETITKTISNHECYYNNCISYYFIINTYFDTRKNMGHYYLFTDILA